MKRGSGWCGYKTHLSEVCELGAPHLITHVATTDATVKDTEMTEPVHQGLTERELLPGEHVVDAGYVTAAHIVTARDKHRIDLIGPVGLDTHHGQQGSDHLDQSAFAVDWQGQDRHVSARYDQRRPSGTPITRVHFALADCSPCPARTQCTRAANGKYGRALTLLPQEQQKALWQRRAEQETEEWKARYNVRAGVEGTISQAVRRTGIRRTRYTGLPKTHLGHVLAATALNLLRLDAWLAGTPLGTTRTSHLAALDLAA